MTNFDLQPTLLGKKIGLRPLRESDFEALYAVASDPLIWEQHPEKDRYKREVFEAFFRAGMDSKGALLAYDLATGEVIGSSRFNALDETRGRVEIGYTFLTRKCWGQGHNLEMKTLMLDHAFKYLGQVVFLIGENNFRSRRAVEKIGAEFIEKFERQSKDGSRYFVMIYGIEKKKWHS